MEQIFNLLLGSFDFGYMFTVNILTYLIIKLIDQLNGEKKVPTYLKRIVAVFSGSLLGGILFMYSGFSMTIIYSFILSLVTWDCLFKPLIKNFKNINYNVDSVEEL